MTDFFGRKAPHKQVSGTPETYQLSEPRHRCHSIIAQPPAPATASIHTVTHIETHKETNTRRDTRSATLNIPHHRSLKPKLQILNPPVGRAWKVVVSQVLDLWRPAWSALVPYMICHRVAVWSVTPGAGADLGGAEHLSYACCIFWYIYIHI